MRIKRLSAAQLEDIAFMQSLEVNEELVNIESGQLAAVHGVRMRERKIVILHQNGRRSKPGARQVRTHYRKLVEGEKHE